MAWMTVTHWIARFVLLGLLGLSVWSISIMLDRYRYFKALRGRGFATRLQGLLHAGDLAGFRQAVTQSTDEPVARALLPAVTSSSAESIDRAVRGALLDQRGGLESGLTVLATLGSNAPFVGLFGTVLGIIEAFGQLSNAQVGTQGVVGGISEALIATAIGLFVAIPAVVAYNTFSKWAKDVQTSVEILRDLYVAQLASPKASHGG